MTTKLPSALALAVFALRDARIEQERVSALIALKRAVFDQDNAELLKSVKDAKDAAGAADTALRAIALEEYKRTKEKKPTAGVEVKMSTIYTYDANKAFEWAKEKKMALNPESLDVKAFEKIITVSPVEFVTMTQEPAIQIASDLVKAIGSDPIPKTIAGPSPELQAEMIAHEAKVNGEPTLIFAPLDKTAPPLVDDDDDLPF